MQGLGQGTDPLVRVIPPRPGQKEKRFVQLLAGEPPPEVLAPAEEPRAAPAPTPSRLESLEAEVAALKTELAALRAEFAVLRKQFDLAQSSKFLNCGSKNNHVSG